MVIFAHSLPARFARHPPPICELVESMRDNLVIIWPALRSYVTEPKPNSALIFAWPSDAIDESALSKRTQELFIALYFLLLMAADPSQPPSFAAAQAHAETSNTFEPASPIRTFLSFGGSPFCQHCPRTVVSSAAIPGTRRTIVLC